MGTALVWLQRSFILFKQVHVGPGPDSCADELRSVPGWCGGRCGEGVGAAGSHMTGQVEFICL